MPQNNKDFRTLASRIEKFEEQNRNSVDRAQEIYNQKTVNYWSKVMKTRRLRSSRTCANSTPRFSSRLRQNTHSRAIATAGLSINRNKMFSRGALNPQNAPITQIGIIVY